MAWEPAWKSLVEDLQSRGFESPYLDRLKERLDVYQDRSSLEREILQEMAYALGRAEDKVNVALLRLDVTARELDAATEPATRAARLAEHERRRQEALAARRELMIHREALGMYRHGALERLYPIPPRRES